MGFAALCVALARCIIVAKILLLPSVHSGCYSNQITSFSLSFKLKEYANYYLYFFSVNNTD